MGLPSETDVATHERPQADADERSQECAIHAACPRGAPPQCRGRAVAADMSLNPENSSQGWPKSGVQPNTLCSVCCSVP
jgi:hypothetical protein